MQYEVTNWFEDVLHGASSQIKKSNPLRSDPLLDVNWPFQCGPMPTLASRDAAKRAHSAEVFA